MGKNPQKSKISVVSRVLLALPVIITTYDFSTTGSFFGLDTVGVACEIQHKLLKLKRLKVNPDDQLFSFFFFFFFQLRIRLPAVEVACKIQHETVKD